jgi:hypothetical protein
MLKKKSLIIVRKYKKWKDGVENEEFINITANVIRK